MRNILIAALVLFLLLLGAILFYRAGGREDPQHIRVGLVLTGARNGDGWSTSHFKALNEASREMGFELLVRENVSEYDDSAMPVVAELCDAGARIVCLAGMNYSDKVDRLRRKYPKVFFLHASGLEHARNLTSFFGKMYQARYLSGIVAGMATKTNQLGVVAAMEVDEVVRGVNAFTLGARSVNPEATVWVRYSGRWDAALAERQAAQRLVDKHNVDVMTYHQNWPHAARFADERGLYSIMYHVANDGGLSDRCLTAAVWNWTPFYREHIADSLYSRFRSGKYWVGLEKGIVDIAPLSPLAPAGAAEKVATERERMKKGVWDVFRGPIRDNKNKLRIEAGSVMSDEQMIYHFDWYVEGVKVDGE